MTKKLIFAVFLLLCLFSSTAYAETGTESGKTRTITLTEQNRYDPVYYQKPEELYPAVNDKLSRSTELSLEEYVVRALENFETEINVSAYQIPRGEASARYLQILNNHPSLFYVVHSVTYSYSLSTDQVINLGVEYTDTEVNIRAQQEAFNREVEQALARIDPSMTDAEKALVVHDYLVLDCEYDYERLQNNSLPYSSHTAYGALVNKMAVCDGYASAYSCILEKLGISSTVVSSDSMDHAWNMVLIDEEWYHVDVTWDDPVPDSIGYVEHNYFLLSDTAISDSEHNHTGWSSGYTADSNTYNNEFWTEIRSAFCYQKETWYYVSYYAATRKENLLKRNGRLLDTSEEIIYTVDETWNNYSGGYMYLDLEPIKNEIYFNTRTKICKLDETGENYTVVYEPECTADQLIFGFTVRDAQLCYALQSTPNIESKQIVSTYTLEDLLLPQITGITAKNQETVYDGTAKQIQVEGTREGDRITYKHEDGTYKAEQPEMKNAGTYPVSFQVERDGYEPYTGDAYIVIRKAEPVYTIPAGLQGSMGRLLGQVALPQGFVWEDVSIELSEEGEVTGYVSYVPEDTQNYETVSHIAVKVTVSGPEDSYIEEMTPAPTITQKPDNTQAPDYVQMPAQISGLTVDKATTNTLKFSWNKVSGAKYRLILYKGNAAVSTIYTETNTYTCKKLKAATLYTVKITSYVESNGTKLYASSDVSIKTATAPAKVQRVSAKKKGKTKAKITWKKVTGADGYEISMRTGKGSYKIIKTITKGKTVSFTRSGLKKGKRYRFRIRSYKKAGNSKSYGSYSKVKTFKIL